MSWRQVVSKAQPPTVGLRCASRCLDRDGWACVKCGKAGRLECDHRIPLEDGGAVYEHGEPTRLFAGAVTGRSHNVSDGGGSQTRKSRNGGGT